MVPGAALIGNIHMNPFSASGLLSLAARGVGRRRATISRRACERLLYRHGFEISAWSGFRLLPTIWGRPVLGDSVQSAFEGRLRHKGFQFFGADQVFVAKRL